MLEGKISNVLLLQFTARLCSQKMRNGEIDRPQISRKPTLVMLHRSLESFKLSNIETKNLIVPRNLNLKYKE